MSSVLVDLESHDRVLDARSVTIRGRRRGQRRQLTNVEMLRAGHLEVEVPTFDGGTCAQASRRRQQHETRGLR